MRVNYIKHYQKRVAFIDSLRDQGYTGKAYSDKVVEFDKLAA